MEVIWRDWPAQRQRKRAIVATVLIVLTSVSTATIEPLIAAIGTIALLAAVSEVLLPTTYTLSQDGVAMDNVLRKRRHPWRHFRGWRPAPGTIVLLGDGPAALIRRRRSLLLRCPDNRAQVIEALGVLMPGDDP
jgi:hypothetical protein